MCQYTKAIRIYRNCPRRPNRHQVEQRYYDKCPKARNSQAYCSDAMERADIAQFGSTPIGGQCPTCRDSGVSVGTVRIEKVRYRDHNKFLTAFNTFLQLDNNAAR